MNAKEKALKHLRSISNMSGEFYWDDCNEALDIAIKEKDKEKELALKEWANNIFEDIENIDGIDDKECAEMFKEIKNKFLEAEND